VAINQLLIYPLTLIKIRIIAPLNLKLILIISVKPQINKILKRTLKIQVKIKIQVLYLITGVI